MLNAEKFKKEIKAITDKNYEFAVMADNPTVIKICNISVRCCDCLFDNNICYTNKIRWLLSEYKEPIKLTKLEYELLKFWNSKKYKYIARDSNDSMYVYREKPSKKSELWGSIYEHRVEQEFDKLFLFVKWEDLEPTSIKEVLDNCEVKEDEKH